MVNDRITEIREERTTAGEGYQSPRHGTTGTTSKSSIDYTIATENVALVKGLFGAGVYREAPRAWYLVKTKMAQD